MSYLNLVDRNLTKAYSIIKDLAVTAHFHKKTNTSFDFNRGVAKTKDNGTISAPVVIIDNSNSSKDRKTQQMSIIFKSKDVGDFILFEIETVTIGGVVWTIGKYIKSDRFISIVELFREN